MRYRIYEEFYENVEKKLKRIERKCKKYGNDFVFKVVGSEIEKVDNKYYKFIIVEVEGAAKINNYECVAVLENHEHGNVIRRINTEIELPERFINTSNICEHCNSNRRRNELYVVYNNETNEFKQVGKNCLMLYTNGLNAEYITSYIDGIVELEEFDGVVVGGSKYYISNEEAIGYATEIIDKVGYFNANSNCSTKELVAEITDIAYGFKNRIENLNRTLKDNGYTKRFNIEDFNKEDTKEKTKKIIEYYLSLEDNSEFINNVKVILRDEYVSYKNLGFLCCLPKGYSKHIEKEIEKEKQNIIKKESKHFGEVGKRYKDINVCNIENVASYDTMYGAIYVYRIVLEDGNVLVWKTSNWLSNKDIESVRGITFTIKNHGEYKGVKQTEVTRCKLSK